MRSFIIEYLWCSDRLREQLNDHAAVVSKGWNRFNFVCMASQANLQMLPWTFVSVADEERSFTNSFVTDFVPSLQ